MGLEIKESSQPQEKSTKKNKKAAPQKSVPLNSDELTNDYRDRILSIFQKQKKYARS